MVLHDTFQSLRMARFKRHCRRYIAMVHVYKRQHHHQHMSSPISQETLSKNVSKIDHPKIIPTRVYHVSKMHKRTHIVEAQS